MLTEASLKPEDRGLVIVYTGEGKGKTTAAMGLALRAAGYDRRVKVIQFVKIWFTGEKGGFEHLPNVDFVQAGKGFYKILNDKLPEQDHLAAASAAADLALAALTGDEYGVVVLDEIIGTVHGGLLPVERLNELLDARPLAVDLVLTGRHADLVPGLLGRADLVTEMVKIKHPYDSGILARKTIDY